MSKKKSRVSKKRRKRPFKEKEFVQTVWKVMKKQAKANPAVAELHERLNTDLPLIDFVKKLKK